MTSKIRLRWAWLLARLRPARTAPPSGNSAVILVAIPVAVVAVMAGKVSYSHITALGLRTFQGPTDAHLLAVPIDGLIVAGSVLLAAGSALGWLGVIPGVAATLFANLQYGLPHGALPAAVSTWPAVAFTVACFMLERWLRRRRRGVIAAAGSDTTATAATGSARVRDILKTSPTLAKENVAAMADVSVRTVERVKKQAMNGSGK